MDMIFEVTFNLKFLHVNKYLIKKERIKKMNSIVTNGTEKEKCQANQSIKVKECKKYLVGWLLSQVKIFDVEDFGSLSFVL